ncbi:MAG: alpha/beta hydrolase [Anaerolineales bacterium]
MATIKVNGINLYYREAGSGEPLLLVHGAGFNADVWDKVIDAFARDYRTIVYDRRAYQRSQGKPPALAKYASQQGEDITALLQALNATPANMVGWSAGGIFSLHTVLMRPDYFKHLILYEPPLYALRFIFADYSLLKEFARMYWLKAIGKQPAAAVCFARMVSAYQDGRNSYDQFSAEFRANLATDAGTLFAELPAVLEGKPKPEILKAQIKAPVTLLVGGKSTITAKLAIEYLAKILQDNALVVRLPESNHFAHTDQPDQFVKAVKEALAQR